MNAAFWVVLFYGIFSIAGGLIGYFKANSMVSLLAGGIAGVILLISAYGLSKASTWAAYTALIVAIVLGARFLITLLSAFKIMPNLVMVLFSLATVVTVLLMLLNKKP
ncbi:MAG: TMEM14 family protein [Calditrichia bacterium]